MKIKRLNRTSPYMHIIMIILVAINIFPILWMFSSAFKLPTELFTSELRLIPKSPTFENFRIALVEYQFSRWFINSVITTLGIAVGQMVVAVLASYAIVFFKTRHNEWVFYLLIATMVVPFQVTMIPNYILISKMGLLNTLGGVILPNLVGASTFFFIRQHFKSVPIVFYEAASIEGAKSFWILAKVVVPLCKGAISAMSILCVIDGWNLYFWPLLILSKPETRTLTIGLQQFLDHESGSKWGPFMATATLASLPIIILYIFIQKSIIEAFVSSGIKG